MSNGKQYPKLLIQDAQAEGFVNSPQGARQPATSNKHHSNKLKADSINNKRQRNRVALVIKANNKAVSSLSNNSKEDLQVSSNNKEQRQSKIKYSKTEATSRADFLTKGSSNKRLK